MATLSELETKLDIELKSIHIENNIDLHSIDFYSGQSQLFPNILYISEEPVDFPDAAFLYYEEYETGQDRAVITRDMTNDIFFKINHYLLEENSIAMKNQNILTSLILGGGIKQIVSIAAKIMHSPIILTTAAYKVIAMEDDGFTVDDPIWQSAVKFGYCDSTSIQTFEKEGVTEKVNRNDAFILDTGLGEKIPRMLDKIVINGKIVAYIGAFAINKRFIQSDINTFKLVCSILKNEMMKDPTYYNLTNIIYESIIQELLTDKISNQIVLAERLESSNWKTKKYFRCLIISTEKFENASYMIETITSEMNLKAIVYNDKIVVIANYNTNAKWHEQLSKLEGKCRDVELKIGISNEFDNLLDLKKAYSEAQQTIEIAARLSAKDTTFYYAGLLPFVLFSKIDEETLISLKNVYYERLSEYDEMHHTEYTKTLYYYVLYNTNMNKTAEKLNLHRNSLAHRIDKIVEICNIPIDNGVVLENYILYYQIRYFLNKSKNEDE